MKNLFKNKKAFAVLAGILAVAAAAIGIAFGVKSCQTEKSEEGNVNFSIEYLNDNYAAGDTAVFRIKAYSDVEPSSIVYTFDNGEERTLTSKVGETSEDEKDLGKYFIDSGTETLDLTGVSVGEHLIKFYVYEGETRIALGKARIINILSAE